MVVGSIELIPLLDAVGELGDLSELYPETSADAREPYRALDPGLFAGSSWRVPCACFLIRAGGQTVLVDTGVGPSGLWDWGPEVEGGLPEALEEHGVGREEVDVVFLAHLHIDHVGRKDVLVACGHYSGSGIGHIVTREGRVVWEETT